MSLAHRGLISVGAFRSAHQCVSVIRDIRSTCDAIKAVRACTRRRQPLMSKPDEPVLIIAQWPPLPLKRVQQQHMPIAYR